MNETVQNLKKESLDLSKPKGFLSNIFSFNNSKKNQAVELKKESIEREKWKMLGISYWYDNLNFHIDNE